MEQNNTSHYANYIKERENKNIIEDVNGYATYMFQDDYVYIEDIYVVPNKRAQGIAAKYADAIAIEAKERGYNKMLGSVDPNAKKSHDSLLVLLAYGFKLHASANNLMYFIKEI